MRLEFESRFLSRNSWIYGNETT